MRHRLCSDAFFKISWLVRFTGSKYPGKIGLLGSVGSYCPETFGAFGSLMVIGPLKNPFFLLKPADEKVTFVESDQIDPTVYPKFVSGI